MIGKPESEGEEGRQPKGGQVEDGRVFPTSRLDAGMSADGKSVMSLKKNNGMEAGKDHEWGHNVESFSISRNAPQKCHLYNWLSNQTTIFMPLGSYVCDYTIVRQIPVNNAETWP